MTSALTPSCASRAAASSARETMTDVATIVTSGPSRLASARPSGMATLSSGRDRVPDTRVCARRRSPVCRHGYCPAADPWRRPAWTASRPSDRARGRTTLRLQRRNVVIHPRGAPDIRRRHVCCASESRHAGTDVLGDLRSLEPFKAARMSGSCCPCLIGHPRDPSDAYIRRADCVDNSRTSDTPRDRAYSSIAVTRPLLIS